uniref:Cadherin domain-containing protein n=1 Tax=Neogobius melanostomus TaxID=47308 RepID=A0A8C6WT05_9GOBI
MIYTTDMLDRETKDSYWLTVYASDHGVVPQFASIEVYIQVEDVNDNAPLTSEPLYRPSISENAPRDVSVIQIQAQDPDTAPPGGQDRLSYKIVSGNPQNFFAINPRTGQKAFAAGNYDILTVRTVDGNVEPGTLLRNSLITRCFDCDRCLTVHITVMDNNDNTPVFSQPTYDITISEDTPPDSEVVQVLASDRDEHHKLTYSLQSAIDPNSLLARDLDLSSIGHYVLTVRVTDNGSPPLSTTTVVRIAVTLSDNAGPKFPQPEYQAELTEKAAIGTSVITINAVSQSTLTYNIKLGNANHVFQINQYSGVITTQKPLDYETKPSYTLIVQAANMAGMATNVTVIIQVVDENDNQPVFQQLHYRGSISEAAPINSVVLNSDNSPLVIKATDADRNQNAVLIYQIVEDTAKMFFTVDSGTGSIRTIANLDHETISSFRFHVHVRDNGKPQLTADSPTEVSIQVIDTNDSPPRFTQNAYEAVLLLPTYVGVEALQVSAVDPDKDVPTELTYTLTDGVLQHFTIKPSSGVIVVKNNNFSKERFRFSVKVSDGKFSSTALVTVLVREALDSGLSFSQSIYTSAIQENIANISKVAVVNAIGNRLNEPLRYTLLNAGTKFRIRPTSGVIQTTGIPFDREEQEFYELVVEAKREHDRLHVARVLVRVQVEDINDNAPVFVGLPYYAAVQVEAEPGSHIFKVMAIDGDKGINGEVSYYLKDDHGTDYFHIDSSSGLILTARMLDHELVQQYNFIVRATDNGFPPLSSEVSVILVVNDLNDNPPVFHQLLYEAYVNELAPRGHFVTCVQASDADSSDFDKLEYSILSGNEKMNFVMDKRTGIITLSSHRKQRMDPVYSLNVSVSDGVFTSTAQVHVKVLGANLFNPVFEQNLYEAEIRENAPSGIKVIQVRISDISIHCY